MSDYQPPRMPSKKWRECIKKIYEVDPLCCPKCARPRQNDVVGLANGFGRAGWEMKIISFIDEILIIKQILEYLGLPARMAGQAGGSQKTSRDPPVRNTSLEDNELTYEPFYEDCSGYEDPCIMAN